MTDTLAAILPSAIEQNAVRETNKLAPDDRAVHDWYRFVLSFPPHLVGEYLDHFGATAHTRVLDPFCGTGTTVVECKKRGIPSVGIEINPVAQFAGAVKTDWTPDPDDLLAHADEIAEIALDRLHSQGIEDNPVHGSSVAPPTLPARLRILPPEQWALLLTNSISPLPLHKTLTVLDILKRDKGARYGSHELLVLANALPFTISNLRFGPEVGLGAIKTDVSVVGT